MKNIREKKENEIYDKEFGQQCRELECCVCCGKMTTVPKTRDINIRKEYIEGSGQLCRQCFYEIYGK